MGLRETINKSKSGMLVLGVLLLAGSTVAIIVQARNMGPAPASDEGTGSCGCGMSASAPP